jgi:hypothetical protein
MEGYKRKPVVLFRLTRSAFVEQYAAVNPRASLKECSGILIVIAGNRDFRVYF